MDHHSARLRRGAALLIATLLVVLMAAPAAADHVMAPTVGVSQNTTATLTRGKNASVTVSGTVTCDQDAGVLVYATVSQPKKRGSVTGRDYVFVDCSGGSAPWAVNVSPTTKGSFGAGAATLSVTAQSYAEAEGTPCDPYASGCLPYQDEAGNVTYVHYDEFIASSSRRITIS